MVLTLTTKYVEYMPEVLEENILYISFKFNLGIHLCACGCKVKTVTPFDDVPDCPGWKLDIKHDKATITPSILNCWCSSHYYITDGNVTWL